MEDATFFQRQIQLPDIGMHGQQALSNARVLVVGAGGIGCPALLYLAAAGIGHLGIVDGDRISATNLHRQVLFGVSDVGHLKVDIARKELSRKYPWTQISAFPFFIDSSNVQEMVDGWDIVLDATDELTVRYSLSDACIAGKKPLVFGAVSGFSLQFSVLGYDVKSGNAYSVRDVFPARAQPAGNCEVHGTIGFVPAMAAMLQVNQVVRVLLHLDGQFTGRIFTLDLRTMRSLEIGLQATMPNSQHEWLIAESVQDEVQELSWEEFLRIQPTVDSLLLDVRRESDARTFEGWNQMAIPAAELSANLFDLEGYSSIYCFCTSGNSSRKAVALLNKAMSGKTIVSIQGGMRVFANLVTGKKEDERAKT